MYKKDTVASVKFYFAIKSMFWKISIIRYWIPIAQN